MSFNHFDAEGHAHMVDVSAKEPTLREARAEAFVVLGETILNAVLDGSITKGDVLGVARLAGINAVKKTCDLIPLSHPLAIHYAAVDFDPETESGRIRVRCTVRAVEKTGVEMEAMTGAAVAALTIYDMCKGQDKSISVKQLRLLFKIGGKNGVYRTDDGADA